MSHTAPAGRPKAAQSAALAQPLSAEPLRGALLQSVGVSEMPASSQKTSGVSIEKLFARHRGKVFG